MQQGHKAHGGMGSDMMGKPYTMLAVNLLISFAIMYLGMFAMIWSLGEFVQNINFFYMALVMWAPMAVVMLLTMKSMFMNPRLNMILYAAFAAIFVLSFWGIRDQLLVGDREFVRSMIPHHAGALTMCNRAEIRDAELRDLCFGPNGIVQSQTREIRQMKAILKRL